MFAVSEQNDNANRNKSPMAVKFDFHDCVRRCTVLGRTGLGDLSARWRYGPNVALGIGGSTFLR